LVIVSTSFGHFFCPLVSLDKAVEKKFQKILMGEGIMKGGAQTVGIAFLSLRKDL